MLEISHPISFVNVNKAGLTDATITLIKRTLLAYTDANQFIAEDIYEIEEWRARVDILDNTPEWKQLEELAHICFSAGASYFRLTDDSYPVIDHYPTYITMEQAHNLAKIAVVLADQILLILCYTTKKGQEASIDIIWQWALEFLLQAGKLMDYDGWSEQLISWGQERLRKFQRGEG